MARKGPLRRVVDTFYRDYKLPEGARPLRQAVELLECGHVQRVISDFYGETNAYCRRCRKCREGLPPDMPLPVPSEGARQA